MSLLSRGLGYLYERYFVDGGDILARGSRVRSCVSRQELLNSEAVFLITPGRSGTKSLIEYCKKNSNLYSVHAPTPWLASTGYAYHQGVISDEAAASAFYAARERYLLNAFERDFVLFDGDCKNLPLIPVVSKVMPNAKFLHVVRNPRSFIKSGLVRGYYEKKSPEMWGHLSPRVALGGQIEKIAYFWNEANVIAEQVKAEVGATRVQTVVADQMFASQEIIPESFDALGLSRFFHTREVGALGKLNSQAGVDGFDDLILSRIDAAISSICETKSLYFK